MTNQQANSALVTEFKGSPEAKFFMVKFLSKFPNGSGRIDDFARFSRKLGFTKPVTTRCISELVRLGLLLDGRHQRGEKPYRIINLSTKLQELVHTERTTPLHQRHMGQLLAWGEEPLRERRHRLTINKRLVLLFLLAHADQAGIVRGVSASKLSRCTGLNSQQAKNNIRLLTQHQYISSVLPGGNFPGTMGKASSIYKLDLRHPAYGNDRPPGTILLFQSRLVPGNDLHEAAWLNLLAQKTANQDVTSITGEAATEFKRYIKGKMSGAMQQRLQWEMVDIASIVISADSNDQAKSSRLIKSEISARIFADLKESTVSKDEILIQGQSIISNFIERISQRVRSLLDQLEGIPQPVAFCQILPMQKGDRSNETFAVEICSTRTSEIRKQDIRAILFDFNSCKIQKKKTYATLDEVSIDSRHRWGLLTKPLKQPELRVPPSRSASPAKD